MVIEKRKKRRQSFQILKQDDSGFVIIGLARIYWIQNCWIGVQDKKVIYI